LPIINSLSYNYEFSDYVNIIDKECKSIENIVDSMKADISSSFSNISIRSNFNQVEGEGKDLLDYLISGNCLSFICNNYISSISLSINLIHYHL
jgi:hypothetical protein